MGDGDLLLRIENSWGEICRSVRFDHVLSSALLREAFLGGLEEGTLDLVLPRQYSTVHAELLTGPRSRRLIEKAIEEQTGERVLFSVRVAK